MFSLPPPPPFTLLDEQGNPLAMDDFNTIDFGAVAHKEIIQNVKIILTTLRSTVSLYRTQFMSHEFVDEPRNVAKKDIIEDLLEIQYHEPRVEVIDIDFSGDPLTGHLIPSVKLKIRNVIYKTSKPYTQAYAFPPPTV